MPCARPTRRTTSAGQYDGYLDIDGVAADSTTETYAALRLDIDNWRWSGVPFFIRDGEASAGDADRAPARLQAPAEARVRRARDAAPSRTSSWSSSTRRPASRSQLDARRADSDATKAAPIKLDMEFAEEGGEGATPYEVLLHAAMVGESTRFTRQDGVEETWRIMQPLLDDPPPVHPYAPGSWGPEAADELVAGHGRWHGPWMAS